MRRFFSALLFLLPIAAIAGPGDTTWVQGQNNLQLNAYGAFDAPIAFPTGTATYRKIYLVFTLGTYNCPAGSQYCHQWDYDVHNVLMTPTGDTVELSRFITPYANTGVPRFPTGWTHRYVFDVTDYAPLLKGSNTFRIFYSGYSWGFTANVRFAFVEGTPERNVVGITKLWTGSYEYGNSANPIDNRVTAVNRTVPAGAQSADMKMLITGHGSDANGCCEFASHNYMVKINNSTVATKAIWRDDCGYNELYPQGGTWIFDRANWCPGAIVAPNIHRLAGLTAGTSYTTDLDFDAYTASSNYGSYNIQANMIYYGGFNKTNDASLEDIISPTDHEAYFRENPSNGKPIIRVRNSGSANITSMQIAYGVKDSAVATYNWTGSLAPLAEQDITLPELSALKSLSLAGATAASTFVARIASVNGAADGDAKNDTLRSTFTVAPKWPNNFVVAMKTNSVGTGGVGSGTSETSWKITDASGAIVASRNGAALSTQFNDTVRLTNGGMYTLTVMDGSCDGLNWWVWNQNPGYGITSGTFVVRNAANSSVLPLKGVTTSGTYAADFGCGFSQSFSIQQSATGIVDVSAANASLTASPNPATDQLNLSLAGLQTVGGSLALYDVTGRLVKQLRVNSSSTAISLQNWNDGHYTAVYTDAKTGARLKTVFIVVR